MVDDKTLERFMSKIKFFAHDGCWEWTGHLNNKGYGSFKVNGKRCMPHRFSFFIANTIGESDLLVCHKCDNPRCVNPEHLFLGTQSDNLRDCVLKKRHKESRKTHCPRGHDYNEENTRYNKHGHRRCRICVNMLSIEKYHKRKNVFTDAAK
jgi:hypothetical protein